jgi:hypothetical protein
MSLGLSRCASRAHRRLGKEAFGKSKAYHKERSRRQAQEAGGRKQEAGSRRQEAGGRKQEAGSRRQEAGLRLFSCVVCLERALVPPDAMADKTSI